MTQANSNDRGCRAEEVASWYFRLNGFLSIPGFVLHSDRPNRQTTEADLLAVRFPYSEESIRDARMTDDRWIQSSADNRQVLCVIAEITLQGCKVNDAWKDPVRGCMERTIRRLGFVAPDKVDEIAKAMYARLHWENDTHVLSFVAIGKSRNRTLSQRYPELVLLTWDAIAQFIWERFQGFGYLKGIPAQWPHFGRAFAEGFVDGARPTKNDAKEATRQFIDGDAPIWPKTRRPMRQRKLPD